MKSDSSMKNEGIKKSEISQKFEKLKSDSFDVLCRLSQLAEYKTAHKGCHNKRMGYFAAAIARKMGFDEIFAEKMLYASPLHDIGKIGIPDNILVKPDKLTHEEWQLMRQHTMIGEKILEDMNIEFVKLAKEIALTHHEKYNGSGYPKGLQSNNIPVSGRIVAIVDVFDSLTSERPFRDEVFSIKDAFDLIKAAVGSHFDPEVVEVFSSIKDELVRIKGEYKD